MAKTGGQIDEGEPVWDWNSDTVRAGEKASNPKATRFPRAPKSQSPSKPKDGIKKPNAGAASDTRKAGKTIKNTKSNKNIPYYPRNKMGMA